MADSKFKTYTIKDSPVMESFLSSYNKIEKSEALVKVEDSKLEKSDPKTRIAVLNDENNDPPDANNLLKSVLDYVQRNENERVHRLAFETDPTLQNQYQTVYRNKQRLIPDTILKRVAINDELVAAIVQTRCNQMSPFGRPRPDRFSIGYVIETEPGVLSSLTIEQKEALQKRIKVAVDKLYTCGSTKGWSDKDALTLPQCFIKWTRNVCTVGRIATEIIQVYNSAGKKVFHSFRPIDAGTIYYATPQRTAAENVRMQAKKLLESLKNEKLDPRRFEADEYAYIQVIDGQPRQAFTEEECVVYNFYPVVDIELDDYPVTPIDTAITAITTHINISTHSKMYFQSGRATKGMIVIKSDDVDPKVVASWKQQFNAQINNVNNSWRTPLLNVGQKDEIVWQPIDAARDMEFQYLSDMNSRVIMSAFQISPEELTGFAYLSRGTSSQALSESNNEYKLEAHRDVGIRPLILSFEDFINAKIFPLIDPDLAKICKVKFIGLEAETKEKEGILLQQNQQIHYTTNQILEKVEKPLLSRAMGGDFLLNPLYQAILKDYLTFGEILEYFFDKPGASKDPSFAFYQNDKWMAWQQMQQAAAQLQQASQDQGQQLSDQEREQHYNQGAQDESDNIGLVSTLDDVVSALKPEEKPQK